MLHRPLSLWFARVRSGCAGLLGGPRAGGRGYHGGEGGGGVVGARDPRAYDAYYI